MMGRLLAICLVALFVTTTAHAETEVQSSWYLGSGVPGPVTEWGESFWMSESIAYSVEGQISLLAASVDHNAWTKHVIDTDSRIDGHATILPADIDNDGYTDLVAILDNYPGMIVWYEYTSSGYVRHDIYEINSVRQGTTWPYDMDGDGDIDIVASATEGLIWLENNGGVFNKWVIDTSRGYQYARPGDVDNDGDIDIILHDLSWDYMHGDLWLFRNDGTMSFTSEMIYNTNSDLIWRINVGDLDGDGYLDIQTSMDPIMVFLNDGTGAFSLKYTYNGQAMVDGSWLSDFDTDGDLDIMGAHFGAAPYYPRDLFWLENDGSGMSFTHHSIGGANGDYGDGGMAADVDLDGRMDALGAYRRVGWFEQLSGGGYAEHPLPNGYVGNSHWIYAENLDGGPCIGDVDVDVLVSDYGEFLRWENRIVTFHKHGTLVSSILDAQFLALWHTFGWDDCEPEGCNNEYYVRSGRTVAELESSPWLGPIVSSGDSLEGYGIEVGRYFQYKLMMENLTAAEDISPSILEIWVTYEGLFCEPVEPWLVRTQGYWKRQCKDDAHEDICAYIDSIHAYVDLFDGFDCDSICGLMKVNPPERDMCRKARRQFMALLLNIASGKLALCNCLEDGSEVGDVVAEIDSLLLGMPDHATCVYAKTLADNINNGIGIVPCDTLFYPVPPTSVLCVSYPVTPNPFVNSTTIRYELPTSAHVQLKLYDKMGRLVKILVDRMQEPGFYQVEWKGSDNTGRKLPSGIYFSRLKTGSSTSASKLILLR
ncbi:T9SS type A sorting domain-containing protein [candidate division TA06 bacterium]|uniref:T9SS type A sorting domain-containing protein n=1 Tax=candidate division TA06 bacterium TaxID=2250710 RepID=A0A523UUE7_UNCT6|nr:MAG: T9SS type A sorting domain-containing protein [candidate division TA06 bacterium]